MKIAIAIPAICALVFRAWYKKSLTGPGLFTATVTAIAHAYHPWNMPFALLCIFFLAGTRVTHIKEDVKAKLTLSSKGSSGGEGPRTHTQVLANSLAASFLAILHGTQLYIRRARIENDELPDPAGSMCFSWGGDVLVVGIIANYAAVAADTFSSELGILATGEPRLITSLNFRKVPRGTNGGVTLAGLAAGLLGSTMIVTASVLFMPMCDADTEGVLGGGIAWTLKNRRVFMGALVIWGFLGSVLDSVLGGLFQRSVKDTRSGKIVEGEGGSHVLISDSGATAKKSDDGPSRVVENGRDWLDNNDVNFVMAVTMTVGSMAVASLYWGVPFESILRA